MSTEQLEPIRAQVAVVGGGIAGAWHAYRLAQYGVSTILICADEAVPPLSRIWAPGVIRKTVIDGSKSPAEVFADRSTTQDPSYRRLMAKRAVQEFNAYTKVVDYYTVDERFFHPVNPHTGIRLTVGDSVVATILRHYEQLGGKRTQGRVTDLVIDGGVCLGLRYEHGGASGRILCAEVVLASGGFCGLFPDGVGYNPGYLLGTYARSGGALANLELFNRFSLGDLDRRRPLYPFDLDKGMRLLRDGEPAEELAQGLQSFYGDQCDIELFARYWSKHLDTPHTIELAQGTFRLWPVRGFAMGGMAPRMATATTPGNVHAIGECAYGMSLDSVTGKPFVSFLAAGAELAQELAAKSTRSTHEDFAPAAAAAPVDTSLRDEVGRRLFAFQDTRFSIAAAEAFIDWCARQRRERSREANRDSESIDLLILAEAFTKSVLARRESRGFFFRPDFPHQDPALNGQVTVARYVPARDEVEVTWVGVPTVAREASAGHVEETQQA